MRPATIDKLVTAMYEARNLQRTDLKAPSAYDWVRWNAAGFGLGFGLVLFAGTMAFIGLIARSASVAMTLLTASFVAAIPAGIWSAIRFRRALSLRRVRGAVNHMKSVIAEENAGIDELNEADSRVVIGDGDWRLPGIMSHLRRFARQG